METATFKTIYFEIVFLFLSGLCHVQFFIFVFGMLVIHCNTECVQNLTPCQVVSDTVVKK